MALGLRRPSAPVPAPYTRHLNIGDSWSDLISASLLSSVCKTISFIDMSHACRTHVTVPNRSEEAVLPTSLD